MRIQIKTLENQDYQDLILTLDIIAGDIVDVSNQISNNHFKARIYSKHFSYLEKLEQDNERLKKELKDLTAYLNQLVEQI